MATVTLQGKPFDTVGQLPKVGDKAPAFQLCTDDLSDLSLSDLKGRVVLNIFPSIDTPTCAQSVRAFNSKASAMGNTTVLCVSVDLPFAMSRFCGAEGLSNVKVASAFRSPFGQDYGVTLKNGPLTGLLARAIVVIDTEGRVIHTELVPEIADEPNYQSVLDVLN